MKLSQMTFTKVENYLKNRESIILPIGSTEQHSPVGLLGTDFIIAKELSYALGEKTNTPVTPPIAFGMANHHLAFPGTISLNPTTLIAVIKDVISSLYQNGFKKFYFINGHGGNVATAQAAFSELMRDINIYCRIKSWWLDEDIMKLHKKLFGDKDGHHATASEVSVTIYLHKESFDLPIPPFTVEKVKHHWPLSPKDFKKHFPDGRMESDPSLASYEHGKRIFEKSVELLEKDFLEFEKL